MRRFAAILFGLLVVAIAIPYDAVADGPTSALALTLEADKSRAVHHYAQAARLDQRALRLAAHLNDEPFVQRLHLDLGADHFGAGESCKANAEWKKAGVFDEDSLDRGRDIVAAIREARYGMALSILQAIETSGDPQLAGILRTSQTPGGMRPAYEAARTIRSSLGWMLLAKGILALSQGDPGWRADLADAASADQPVPRLVPVWDYNQTAAQIAALSCGGKR